MRPLVWFRSDLRVRDNASLHSACARATRGVVAVFTICPRQWHEDHEWGAMKAGFVLRCVAALSEALRQRNIALRLITTDRFDAVPRALLGLARRERCDALHFGDEYELNEARRDAAVEALFTEHGLGVHRACDAALYPPGSVLTGEGRVYTVFSPFKRACKARWKEGDQPDALGLPKKQDAMVGEPDAVPELAELRLFGDGGDAATRPDLWKAGEVAASARLTAFIEHRLEGYKDGRDDYTTNATSTLSPHLAAGVVGVRQCVAAALEANHGRIDSGSAGAVSWMDELLWREFYKHLTAQLPRLSRGENMKREYDVLRWRDSEGDLAAWREARTGYPIVDAAMRQLLQTGWMHNRLRMVVAMFLTKELLIHWRRGESHFCRMLVDLDYASNNGGWQWSASTGADAAPYFRIMNPVTQSKRHDPDGAFIRRFVPELAGVEGEAIHEPWVLPALLRRGLDYPEPIVDREVARARALAAFEAARGG